MKLLALLFVLAGSLTPLSAQSVPASPISVTQKEITPNADGKNDFFNIENISDFPDNRVTIFNRWEKKVFEIWGYDDKENVFAGKANTPAVEDLPPGTYHYIISLNDGSNSVEGYLVLKR